LNIGGFGDYAIAKLLNMKEVPGFGSSKRWEKSTIHIMLTSRATSVGSVSKKAKQLRGKEEFVGDPVPHYYPAVIDAADF